MAVLCKDPASLRPRFVTGHAVLKLLTCASPPDMSSKFSLPHLVLRRLEQLRKAVYSVSTMACYCTNSSVR